MAVMDCKIRENNNEKRIKMLFNKLELSMEVNVQAKKLLIVNYAILKCW